MDSSTLVDKIKRFTQKDIFFVLIILILGLLSLIWFRGQFLVNPGDTNFSFNPLNDLYRSFFVWDHQQELGRLDSMAAAKIFPYNTLLAFLTWLGSSIYSAQKILFYLLFAGAGVSSYLAVRYFTVSYQYSMIGSFVAANLYMVNSYLLQLRWGDTYYMSLFLYAVFPLLILFWFKAKDSNLVKYSILFIIALLFALPTFTNIAYLIPVVGICFIDLVISFLLNWRNLAKKKHLLKLFGFLTLLFMLVFSFLVISQTIPLKNQIANLTSSSNLFEIVKTGSSQTSILNLFRGLGYWGFWGEFNHELYHPYSIPYNSALFVIIGFVITILVFIPLLVFRKVGSKIQYYSFFFGLIFILGIWFSKGIHEPLGQFYYWALKYIPFFGIFRFAHDKFGMLMVIASTILVGIAVSYVVGCLQKKLKMIFVVFIVVIINIYGWPFWTGDIWRNQTATLPGARFQIPESYYELQKYLSNYPEGKILNLPDNAIAVPGIVSINLGDRHYVGADPLNRILYLPIFYLNDFNFDAYGDLINKLYATYYHYPHEFAHVFKKISGVFNTKYILLRGESERKLYPKVRSAGFIKEYLDGNFPLEQQFGTLSLYKINNADYIPHVYIPKKIIYTNGDVGKMIDIPFLGDYSPQSSIFFIEDFANKTIGKYTTASGDNLIEGADEVYVWPKTVSLQQKLQKTNNEVILYPLIWNNFDDWGWKTSSALEQVNEWLLKGKPEGLIVEHIDAINKFVLEMKDFGVSKERLDIYDSRIKQNIQSLNQLPSDEAKMIMAAKIRVNLKSNHATLPHAELQSIATKYIILLNEIVPEDKFAIDDLKFDIPRDGQYLLFYKTIKTYIDVSEKEQEENDVEPWIELGSVDLAKGQIALNQLELYKKLPGSDNVDVVLVNKKGGGNNSPGQIIFTKINPTKYKIRVENITRPYYLVFSEAFHEGWNLYVNSRRDTTKTPVTSRVNTMSYLNGNIQELKGEKNIFNSNSFETWGLTPLPKSKQAIANGYANSWFIEPKWSTEQEIIIEFSPQRVFFISLIISLMAIVVCVAYYIINFRKHE